MITFITVLRALAACFITNAHYTGIYPTDLIANGGLVGDVLFFAISGYCLYNVKTELSLQGFVRWYVRRLRRVYPPVIIATAVILALGAYDFSRHTLFGWFIYPTDYHFAASIVVLYIPYFFIMKIPFFRDHLAEVMEGIFAVWLLVYLLAYDRSFYHIDRVREPMIRFLFMESMLLGAWFRKNDGRLRGHFHPGYAAATLVSLGVYFVSKILFSRRAALSQLQFLNQIAILVVLFCLFRLFDGLDPVLERMPRKLWAVVRLIADHTLEIYVVQYVIIDRIREMGLWFPLNWILITACILAAAIVLHRVCEGLHRLADSVSGSAG